MLRNGVDYKHMAYHMSQLDFECIVKGFKGIERLRFAGGQTDSSAGKSPCPVRERQFHGFRKVDEAAGEMDPFFPRDPRFYTSHN